MKLISLFTFIFLLAYYVGFKIGVYLVVTWFINRYSLKGFELGLDAFTVGGFGLLGGIAGGSVGILIALIILHKLSKKYFPGVRFLRTTFLAFLTFLLLLFLYLLFGIG